MIEKYGKLWKLPGNCDSLEASLESLSLREEKSCYDSNIPRSRLESKEDEDEFDAATPRVQPTSSTSRRLALKPTPSCGGVTRLEAACIMTKEVRGDAWKLQRPPSSGATKRGCDSTGVPATPDKQRRLSTASNTRGDGKVTPVTSSGTTPSTLLTRRATIHSPRPQTSLPAKKTGVVLVDKSTGPPVAAATSQIPTVYGSRDL